MEAKVSNAPWIRLQTDVFQSDWLFPLSEAAKLGWVLLLTEVRRSGRAGVMAWRPQSAGIIAAASNVSERCIELAVAAGIEAGAITLSEGILTLQNWNKYQDSATSVDRQRRRRERQKECDSHKCHVTDVTVTNVTVPPPLPPPLPKTEHSGPIGPSCSPPSRPKRPLTAVQHVAWSEGAGFTGLTEKDRADWTAAYPACELERQIAAAHQWLLANPTRRKKNPRRFLVNWLARAQERGGDSAAKARLNGAQPPEPTPYDLWKARQPKEAHA